MIKDLRSALSTFLKSLISDGVYHVKAPKDAEYPYITYIIKTYPKDNSLRMLEITIDGYDNSEDSGDFENMMFAVSGDGDDIEGLDKCIINKDDYSFTFTLENDIEIEEKSGKSHRQQIYYGSIIGV